MIASAAEPASALWPWLSTIALKTKIAITIEGMPLMTSRASLIASATRRGASSLTKIATSTPMGTANSVAKKTRTMLPTIEFKIPP